MFSIVMRRDACFHSDTICCCVLMYAYMVELCVRVIYVIIMLVMY